MTCTKCLMFGAAALVAVGGTIAFAQSSMTDKARDTKPAAAAQKATGDQDMQLPPGMTEEDMMKCMAAGTPGEMHTHLTQDAGTWKGTTKMWMAPGTEPMVSECTSTITPMMDGRFVKCEVKGDMGEMGPFEGFGLYGYDNTTEKFQSTWVDSMGTMIMFGVGDLSSDGDTLTWTYGYTCPITEKPTTMREVETRKGPNSKTLEIFAKNPKTGEEYKAMEIAFTRTSKATASAGSTSMVSPGMLSNAPAEIGCGLCSYKIDGVKSCSLAAKIDGKTYQVTGSDVNCHQFCGAKGPKPGMISGHIIGNGSIVATNVEVK